MGKSKELFMKEREIDEISFHKKGFIWNDGNVIDFINWYIRIHKLSFNYTLENQTIIDSFKNGDKPEIWCEALSKKQNINNKILLDFGNFKKEVDINIKELNLSFSNLSSIPDSIGNLTGLKELYLYNNKLSTLPDSIGQLTKLKILHLSNNNLSTLPDSIGNLTGLEYLYLSYNNLSTLPDSIGQLTKLKILHLYNNKLSKQEQEKIKKLLPQKTKIIF